MAEPNSDTWQSVDTNSFTKEVKNLKFINISIKHYEKKTGSGFKDEYYAYKVVAILASSDDDDDTTTSTSTSERTRYEVWRRYSEFETLKTFLSTVYSYLVVPPLPEKAIKGSGGLLNKMTFTGEDMEFLLQRQHALEIFLVRISRHPILSKNYWFHQFLQNAAWKEQLLQTGVSLKGDNILHMLSLQMSKKQAESQFQDVKQYADDLESLFKAILDIREQFNSSMKAVYKVHGNYGRVFNEMASAEPNIGLSLQSASGCMDSYSSSVDTYLQEEESRFLLPVKEYIGFCDSLRSVVKRHELLQRQLEKNEEVMSNKAEAKDSLVKNNVETGGTGGKKFMLKNLSARIRGEDTSYDAMYATADRELKEAEDTVQKSQTEFDKFTKNALQEFERFSSQKTGDFRSMLINFVQLQMHTHKKGISHWSRVKAGFQPSEE